MFLCFFNVCIKNYIEIYYLFFLRNHINMVIMSFPLCFSRIQLTFSVFSLFCKYISLLPCLFFSKTSLNPCLGTFIQFIQNVMFCFFCTV